MLAILRLTKWLFETSRLVSFVLLERSKRTKWLYVAWILVNSVFFEKSISVNEWGSVPKFTDVEKVVKFVKASIPVKSFINWLPNTIGGGIISAVIWARIELSIWFCSSKSVDSISTLKLPAAIKNCLKVSSGIVVFCAFVKVMPKNKAT